MKQPAEEKTPSINFIPAESEIEDVTLFQDRALVTRTGTFKPRPENGPEEAAEPAGEGNIDYYFSLGGLPLLLENSTLRLGLLPASSPGPASPSSTESPDENTVGASEFIIRDVRLTVERKADHDPEKPERGELEELERRLGDLYSRRDDRLGVIGEIETWLAEPLPGPPKKDGREQEKPRFPADAYHKYVDHLAERLAKEQEQLRAQEKEIQELEREHQARQEILESRKPDYARDPGRRREKTAIIRLNGPRTGPGDVPRVEFSLSYSIPGARWAPVYWLRISEGRENAELSMGARVVQRTGEDWSGVRLRFSAASLKRQARLPELPSRRIGKVRPPRLPALRKPPEPPLDLLLGFLDWSGSNPAPELPRVEESYPVFFERTREVFAMGQNVIRSAKETEGFSGKKKAPRQKSAGDEIYRTLAAISPGEPEITRGITGVNYPASPPSAPVPGGASVPPPEIKKMADLELRQYALNTADEGAALDVGAEEYSLAEPGVMDMESSVAPDEFALSDLDVMREATLREVSLKSSGHRAKAQKGARRRMEEEELFAGASNSTESNRDDLADSTPGAILDYLEYSLSGPESAAFGVLRKRAGAMLLDENYRDAYNQAKWQSAALRSPGESPPRGFFHVFDSAGRADVPGDGYIHTAPIDTGAGACEFTYRCAPAADEHVYRRLILKNPFDFPLPPGDVAVYQNGAFSFYTRLTEAAGGGDVKIPLGVEERIKIARNTRFREESGAIFSGARLFHEIDIDVKSNLPRDIRLEVLERVPFLKKGEKEIEIKEGEAVPEPEIPESYEGTALPGLRRFELLVKPGETARLNYNFRIDIPGKKEIVGGNRRP